MVETYTEKMNTDRGSVHDPANTEPWDPVELT